MGRIKRIYKDALLVMGVPLVVGLGFGATVGATVGATCFPRTIEKEVEVVEYITQTEYIPVYVSTAETTAETAAEEEPALKSMGVWKVTAYCACKKCCGKSPDDPYFGITATGTKATAGRTIAVDPSVIPYGTEVVIDGHTYIAEDCGGAIKENRIDVYFDSHEDALQFGVQYLDIYVKEDTNNAKS